jgi:hypothetical protein
VHVTGEIANKFIPLPALMEAKDTFFTLLLEETLALVATPALAETPAPRYSGVSARFPAGKQQICNVFVVPSINVRSCFSVHFLFFDGWGNHPAYQSYEKTLKKFLFPEKKSFSLDKT